MMRIPRIGGTAARSCALLAAALGAACESGSDPDLPPAPRTWEWTELGGPDAATPELVANHETLVVAGSDLLLGTADGVWRRPLGGDGPWERSGLEQRTIHALAKTADGGRIVAAGFDPRDESAPTVWYSTSGGIDWVPASTWPRGAPGQPDAGRSFRFATLEPDPHDPYVVYGGLDADSIAVTVDGGATWLLANGALSPSFGYPCVPHRLRAAPVLLQGCELPLDFAWVGAYDVDEDDRFSLSDFRYLRGYPHAEELGNRRINAIASPSGRDDRLLVGVEGALLEITSMDPSWRDRTRIEASWVYRSTGDSASMPYTYVRAIAPLSADGRHVLFGGTVNGTNEVLSLFETSTDGTAVWRLSAPVSLTDPRVEQAVRLGSDDVLLVISDVDAASRRSSRVYRLRR